MWIDVTKRIPEPGKDVLVWGQKGLSIEYQLGGFFDVNLAVTHWSFLPLPPEPKEST